MNLDELVQAAIAKALADYVGTIGALDEGFMGKLADMVADRVEKRWEHLLAAERSRMGQEAKAELAQRMREFEHQMMRASIAHPSHNDTLDKWRKANGM